MDEIQGLKQQVATAVRMCEWADLMDNSGHASIRVPGTGQVLINSRLAARAQVSTEHVITVDLEGRLVAGTGKPPLEVVMHTEVFKARPDVGAVIHVHAPYTTLFGMVGKPMEPYYFRGAMVGHVPIHPDSTLITAHEQAAAMARTLGNGRAVILGAHGAVIAGATIEEAFYVAKYMEDNARMYHKACGIGTPQPLPPDQCERIVQHAFKPEQMRKLWDYCRVKVGLTGTDA